MASGVSGVAQAYTASQSVAPVDRQASQSERRAPQVEKRDEPAREAAALPSASGGRGQIVDIRA